MGALHESKHPPHEEQCQFCHQPILWFWRAGSWHALNIETGQKHRCSEYRDQVQRRHGPVSTRPARTDELERF
jgi:hypothetical protein